MRCNLILIALVIGLFIARYAVGREWTDASGKWKADADLVAYDGKTVVLKKVDGSIVRVDANKLSKPDLAYLEETRTQKGESVGPQSEPQSSPDLDKAKERRIAEIAKLQEAIRELQKQRAAAVKSRDSAALKRANAKLEKTQDTLEQTKKKTLADFAEEIRQDEEAKKDDEAAENGRSPIDLRRAMGRAGFANLSEADVAAFIRYGSNDIAQAAAKGDQFDRIDIKNKTEDHRATLRQKTFRVSNLPIRVATRRNDVETKGLFAELPLPLRVRGKDPFYKDQGNFSGNVASIAPMECYTNQFAFLTKENELMRCAPLEVPIVQQNDGILYHPERAATTLLINFRGDLDTLKDISRNNVDYSAEINLSSLAIETPITWGYFRRDALADADFDCQRVWIDSLAYPREVGPDYFTTAAADEEKEPPEIAFAQLISLRILGKGGEVIGAYRNESHNKAWSKDGL